MARPRKPLDCAEIDRLHDLGLGVREIHAVTGFAIVPIRHRLAQLRDADKDSVIADPASVKKRAAAGAALAKLAELVRLTRCPCGADVIYLATSTGVRCEVCRTVSVFGGVP